MRDNYSDDFTLVDADIQNETSCAACRMPRRRTTLSSPGNNIENYNLISRSINTSKRSGGPSLPPLLGGVATFHGKRAEFVSQSICLDLISLPLCFFACEDGKARLGPSSTVSIINYDKNQDICSVKCMYIRYLETKSSSQLYFDTKERI